MIGKLSLGVLCKYRTKLLAQMPLWSWTPLRLLFRDFRPEPLPVICALLIVQFAYIARPNYYCR
jgi:hypothetical protein